MNNLIPKNVRKSKLEFWRGIGIVEIFIVALWVGLTTLFFLGLPLNLMYKIILTLVISLFSVPLILTVMPGIKGWYAIILIIKFIASQKTYKKQLNFLIPYEKIIADDIVKTKKINGKNKYFKVIEIIGYNLTLLNPEIQQLKISSLHQLFKNIDFEISLLKLDLPASFKKTILFYKKQLKYLEDLYNNNKLTLQQHNSRKSGLENYLLQLEKNNNNYEENNLKINRLFYLYVYGNNSSEVLENLQLVKEKLYSNGFNVTILNGYQTINVINKIFNPYAEDIPVEIYEQYQTNLDNLPFFQEFKYRKNYFKFNNIFYSIHAIYDYPLFTRSGWGAQIAGNEQTIIWNINPIDSKNFKRALNKAINNAQTKQVMTRSNVERSEQNYQLEAYNNLVEDMNGNAEAIRNVNIFF